MTSTKSPEDVQVIREVITGVTTVSVPFLRVNRIKFGGRATIVTLPSRNLAVFSPVALTPSLKTHLSTLGTTVSYLIAPDIEHHIHLSAWSSAYPSAHIIAPESLPEKRAQTNATDKSVAIVPFGTVFTKKAKDSSEGIEIDDKEFAEVFEWEYVDAHPNKELVFFHKPSKTLIEADLLFNLPATEQYSKTGEDASSGLWTKLVSPLMSTKGEAKWQRRVQWYAFSKADREGFNKSVRRISGWGFENLVPCHGDVILGNGKEVFERVFRWHLEGKN